MEQVVVASVNPVKINAVKEAFAAMFPKREITVSGVAVSSGVRPQPMSDRETMEGAEGRCRNAAIAQPAADFWVGLEGGVDSVEGGMEAFAWVYVVAKDGRIGRGKTGGFVLPEKVAELIRAGKELGEADDIVFQKTNSKQQMGAVGILTENAIDRTAYYRNAVILALIPFKHPEYY